MSAPETMSTERLVLRRLTHDHRDDLSRLYSDPDVARYIGGPRLTPAGIDEQLGRLTGNWARHGFGHSAVYLREDDRFIGRVGLQRFDEWDEVELGYALAAHAQGQGLATEACRAWITWARTATTLDHLIAAIHPDNHASLALADRTGFTFDRHDVTATGVHTPVYRLDL